MPFVAVPVEVPEAIQSILSKFAKSRTLPARQVQRAKIILLAALEENIAMVLALEDETSMESIDAKLEELQQELLKQANARQDYEDLADEIDSLRERKQKVMVNNAG